LPAIGGTPGSGKLSKPSKARPHGAEDQASESSTANIGFEAKPRLAADQLRGTMDAAEFKHVVLRAFEEKCGALDERIDIAEREQATLTAGIKS
jgi:hypothetical protein